MPRRSAVSSASSASASEQLTTLQPFTAEFRAELPCGTAVVPPRVIGDTSPDAALSWPPHVEAVLKARAGSPVRLYADGIFDVFHYGHMRALEQAKKAFPNTYLMVGCCNDSLTHKYKGQTVMTDLERYESLRGCKWVDEVIPDAPWVITDAFLAEHDIDFVCHDALPYVDTSGAAASGDVYAHLKAIGKFHETQRTEGVSTSDLIIRIVKRYDDFVRRNLQRGYSARDMNVPFYKEASLQLEMALEKQAVAIQAQMNKLAGAAEELQDEFLGLFSRQGTLRSTFRELRGGLQSLLGLGGHAADTHDGSGAYTHTADAHVHEDATGAAAHASARGEALAGRRRRRSLAGADASTVSTTATSDGHDVSVDDDDEAAAAAAAAAPRKRNRRARGVSFGGSSS